MAPKIDTRRLKRLPDGMFTMLRATEVPEGLGLCETCGNQACPVRARTDEYAKVTIHACHIYIPSIGFSVTAGLDLPNWNTIRIGAAWPKRLKTGDEICIVNTKDNVVVRNMLVESMVTGPLLEIIRDHARNNHAIQSLKPEDPEKEMLRILRNAYGTNFASPDRMATALYLEN